METFVWIGQDNRLDAVMMNHCSADEIVEKMKKGIGDFRTSDGQVCKETADCLLSYHYAEKTKDGEYIVVYDVADKFDNVPLDLVAENAQDENIDIWMREDLLSI